MSANPSDVQTLIHISGFSPLVLLENLITLRPLRN